jgi:sugar-phosphatase
LRAVRLPVPDVLVTADDVAHGKPAPDGYLQAAERLGVPPERCVVVEDSASGVSAGRAAGCRVVGIAGDQLGDVPDIVVSSLADLTARPAGGAVALHVRRTAHV